MTEDVPQGQRFSHLYLRPDSLADDSPRLRKRLVLLSRAVAGTSGQAFGAHLERELGIRVLRQGTMSVYVPWDDIVRWELRDILDMVTLLGRFFSVAGNAKGLAKEVSRIFAEENASYRIDAKFGIHPAVDPAYQANFDSAVRSLATQKHQAVREHLAKADDQLLPTGNTREAIRSCFDGVENLFKQLFTRANSITRASIQNDLKPMIEALFTDPPEKRTALKMVEALSDWVDACHNYRHEPGHAEPTPPNWDMAVMIVSQGMAYARWLAAVTTTYEEKSAPLPPEG